MKCYTHSDCRNVKVKVSESWMLYQDGSVVSHDQGDSVCRGYCPAKRIECDDDHDESVQGPGKKETGCDMPDDNRDVVSITP